MRGIIRAWHLKAVFPSRNLGLFAFQPIYLTNLCFAEFCKFLSDFGRYLGGDSFSQWIGEEK